LSTIPPISTNKKESLNNDCQQFLQYQQTKKKVKTMIDNDSTNINNNNKKEYLSNVC
jgi:hypothetical protein